MTFHRGAIARLLPFIALVLVALTASAQGGNAGVIRGTVTDPSGAVVPNATVHLTYPVSQFEQTTTTDSAGQFAFYNVPFNPYLISASAKGFAQVRQNVVISSSVGASVKLVLQITGGSQTVTVQSSGDLIEDDPTFHTDVDRDEFNKVPLESQSSTLSSLVTLTTPGVAADSNGLFHGLGDHASNSFSIDGQPITDQQSKVFSNQLPADSIQSIEVISGAPPAEFGGKTSLVIVATTRSGQGVTKPTGDISASYGSFGSSTGGFDLSYGGGKWGNFIEGDGLDTGRFLDPPEFVVFHDKGNEENIFDRIDYSFSSKDSIHWDLNYSRSWFQTPNAFQNLNVQNVPTTVPNSGVSLNPAEADLATVNVGNTDQGSKIDTFNVSPTYTHVISVDSVFNLGAFVRKDIYGYYPSANALADLGPENLQTSSISQYRTLTNAAVHGDYSYVKGVHNFKAGFQYGDTFLREHDNFSIVDNLFNAPCVDSTTGEPIYGYPDPTIAVPDPCNETTNTLNGNYNSALAPYDLTRGGTNDLYFGHTDVKELALYVEDQIKAGNWIFNLGMRGDLYNGLTVARQPEPRVGIGYTIKPSSTVVAVSYARTMETPFNENLVLSSTGCTNQVLAPLLGCTTDVSGNFVSKTLEPGFRNEFHANFQQALSKYAVVSGEYIWKYTHNAFDFSVFGNTPVTFPVDWHNSKIPGYALRAEMPESHGFSAYYVMSSVAARFFPPQIAGAGSQSGVSSSTVYPPFRIDHDEKFNETTHFQYTLHNDGWANGLWTGFNWRFDSGLVAGSTPCYDVVNTINGSCSNSSFNPDGTAAMIGGAPAVLLVDNNIVPGTNPVTNNPDYAPLNLTADEEFQAGLSCNGVKATGFNLIGQLINPGPGESYYACQAQPGAWGSGLTSSLLSVPAVNHSDNDHNPPRVAPRSLFDVTIGKNNIFNKEHFKTDLDLTAINVTNKYTLYNYLSTFSGTHYVTPRALTAKVTFNF